MRIYQSYIRPLLHHPLNKNSKGSAILRFLFWQIRLRLAAPNEFIVPFIGDTKFFVKKGRTGVTGNLYSGLHEFYDMMFLLHFLRKEDVFFDVGANVGSYSILSAGVSRALTFSFEPIPSTFELLTNNRNININAHWRLINAAVGDEPGELLFSADKDTMNSVVGEDYRGEKLKVSVTTLSMFCKENAIEPMLMKIDAEGYDSNVIFGAKAILSHPNLKAIIVESSDVAARDLLHSTGFAEYSYNPFTRELAKNGNSESTNSLFLRDESFCKERVVDAPKVKVLKRWI